MSALILSPRTSADVRSGLLEVQLQPPVEPSLLAGGCFKNDGRCAFINAALQCLLHLPRFFRSLLLHKCLKGVKQCLTCCLREIAVAHQSQSVTSADALLSFLSGLEEGIHMNIEKDAYLLVIAILVKVHSEYMKEINMNVGISPMSLIFARQDNLCVSCLKCHYVEKGPNRCAFSLVLPRGCTSVLQGVEDYYEKKKESLEKCKSCGGKGVVTQQKLIRPPNVLLVKVSRFLNESITYPFILPFGKATFKLFSFACKQAGDHWFSISTVREPKSEAWVLFNDAYKTKVSCTRFLNEVSYKTTVSFFLYVMESGGPTSRTKETSVQYPPPAIEKKVQKVQCTPEKLIESWKVEPFGDDGFDIDDPLAMGEENLSLPVKKRKLWKPEIPDDLTDQLAAATSCIPLEYFDPILLESDVPGAVLSCNDPSQARTKKELCRWLECRGLPQVGSRKEVEDRVRLCLNNGVNYPISAQVDNGKWYEEKRKALISQNPNVHHPFLPIIGWGKFPSVDVPKMLNFGHMYVYMVETAPNWTEVMDLSTDFGDDEEVASDIGKSNVFNKAWRFLTSKFVVTLQDVRNEDFYFVKAFVRASMKKTFYYVTITINAVSGSVRVCTCTCKQQALGRCSHVAAVLLFVARHIEEKGYEADTTTTTRCYWETGKIAKDPGDIAEKSYAKLYDTVRRATFNPFGSSVCNEMTCEGFDTVLKDNLLKALQECESDSLWQKSLHFDYGGDYNELPTYIATVQFLRSQFLIALYEQAQEWCDGNKPGEIPNTRAQSKSPTWIRERALRFSSSRCHQTVHLTPKGYLGFLRYSLWQLDEVKEIAALKYGLRSEEKARKIYIIWARKRYRGVKVRVTGMWIHPLYPMLSCSPDALIFLDGEILRLLEIKCPYILRAGDPKKFELYMNADQQKRFCLRRNSRGKLHLKKNHPYWYQIQMSLGILELKECHFMVWSPKGKFIETIKFNEKWWKTTRALLVKRHSDLLIPEYFFNRVPRNLKPFILADE